MTVLHPASLDGALQLAMVCFLEDLSIDELYVLHSVESITIATRRGSRAFDCFVSHVETRGTMMFADVEMREKHSGQTIALMKRFCASKVRKTIQPVTDPPLCYELEWEEHSDGSLVDGGMYVCISMEEFPKEAKKQLCDVLAAEYNWSVDFYVMKDMADENGVKDLHTFMSNGVYSGVLYLSGFVREANELDVLIAAKAVVDALYSGEKNGGPRPRIWFVTSNCQQTVEVDSSTASRRHAGLLGLSRTARVECEGLQISCIDVSVDSKAFEEVEMLDRLSEEMALGLKADSNELEILNCG
eukprot:GHVU01166789.1.p1 GENE.GHVU01166789.1~~GHVU01166789.1.p1  ORF type:complete len:301 (-),score=16.86 GHVU01166789.1:315-1217(-)